MNDIETNFGWTARLLLLSTSYQQGYAIDLSKTIVIVMVDGLVDVSSECLAS